MTVRSVRKEARRRKKLEKYKRGGGKEGEGKERSLRSIRREEERRGEQCN